jgi:hypothetical protein
MGISGGPDMIQDGLVLSLDASDRNSYVSGSATWFDLSGNGNHITLLNNPTYTNENNGGITFNGSNQYGQSSTIFTVPNQITVMVVAKIATSSSQNFTGILHCGSGDFTNNGGNGVFVGYPDGINNTNIRLSYGSGSAVDPIATPGPNSGSYMLLGYSVSAVSRSIELNGTVFGNVARVSANPTHSGSINIAVWSGYGRYFRGTLYNALMYNRGLSSDEMLQNYNALKSRFGLI